MLVSSFRAAAVAAALLAVTAGVRADLLTATIFGNRLVTFDSAAPGVLLTNQPITGLQAGDTIAGIDFRPANGLLYAVGTSNHLYTINTATAVATPLAIGTSLGLSGSIGLDFDPTADVLRAVSTSDQNVRINPNTGTVAATDTPVAYAAGDPSAAANPNVVGLAYSNNFAGAAATTLYGIDSGLDILVTQGGAAGTLHTVGALGFDTSNTTSFDISGTSGTAFAALTAPGPSNFSSLFAINLNTGSATFLGDIGRQSAFDAPVSGLAAPVGVPEPSSLTLVGLVGLGLACLRRRSAR